jgi:chemotaxis protein MotB
MDMRRVFIVFLLASALLAVLSGCVSSREYKARLSEIEGYKSDLSALQAEREALAADKEGLEKEAASLRARNKSLEESGERLAGLLRKKEGELTQEAVALDLRIKGLEGELSACQGRVGELNGRLAAMAEEKEAAVSELKGTYDDLVSELKGEIKEGEIAIIRLKNRLSVSMVDRVLFDSGSARVKADGKKVLDRVAAILGKVADRQIRVEGHTDNVPIGARLKDVFPSNWELSAARATNVVRYLQESGGIDPGSLVAAGYSEYRPVASNESPEGRARNRRIEIVLIPEEPKSPEAGEAQ